MSPQEPKKSGQTATKLLALFFALTALGVMVLIGIVVSTLSKSDAPPATETPASGQPTLETWSPGNTAASTPVTASPYPQPSAASGIPESELASSAPLGLPAKPAGKPTEKKENKTEAVKEIPIEPINKETPIEPTNRPQAGGVAIEPLNISRDPPPRPQAAETPVEPVKPQRSGSRPTPGKPSEGGSATDNLF